jgi:hypothetical protein
LTVCARTAGALAVAALWGAVSPPHPVMVPAVTSEASKTLIVFIFMLIVS